jgi:hypothetical protein
MTCDAFSQNFSLDGLGMDLGRCETLLTIFTCNCHPPSAPSLVLSLCGGCFLWDVVKSKNKKEA